MSAARRYQAVAGKPVQRHFTRTAPFVDRVKCLISSGTGGDGVVMFHHDPNHEFAGPSGANGGRGGSVIAACTRTYPDLAHVKSLGPNVVADSGRKGGCKNLLGGSGNDLVLELPPGTVVTDVDTNTVVLDIDVPGTNVLLLEGGRGGRGNTSFVNAMRHAPNEATKGMPGNTMLTQFELKMIADVGLVGYPNAGKSSLLAAISTAKPKIAPFPFATLHPTIGTLRNVKGESCDVADLPGLIEGAYENRGLGHQFLRHVERTHTLALVVDMVEAYTPPDRSEPQEPWDVVATLLDELEYFLPGLSSRVHFLMANKMDVVRDWRGRPTIQQFQELVKRMPESMKCFPVSAAIGIADGVHSPRAGLSAPLNELCETVWQVKRDLAEERRRRDERESEELVRTFRDANPYLFENATGGTSVERKYRVHYVGPGQLADDLRYTDPVPVSVSRTEDMIARRRGQLPASPSSSSSTPSEQQQRRRRSASGAQRPSGRDAAASQSSSSSSATATATATTKAGSTGGLRGGSDDPMLDAGVQEALRAATRGGSLVDMQLDAVYGDSSAAGSRPQDLYLRLGDSTAPPRDNFTGTLRGKLRR